jgi:hypothetical protein
LVRRRLLLRRCRQQRSTGKREGERETRPALERKLHRDSSVGVRGNEMHPSAKSALALEALCEKERAATRARSLRAWDRPT